LVIRKFPSPEIRHKNILDSQYFDMPKNGENTLVPSITSIIYLMNRG
jgi:hypothetical protein